MNVVLKQIGYLIHEPRKALFGQLALYFLICAGILYAIHHAAGDYIGTTSLPVDTDGTFDKTEFRAERWEPSANNAGFLLYALLNVVLLTIPMTWVYRGTRRRKELDQSIIETVLILPIIVTGIILIVQSNLALAFSLAGLFAGVQFRSRLKEIADAHYLFASIGTALAAGVGAWHIAFALSLFFCFGVYTFWRVGYGNEAGERHLRHVHKNGKKKADEASSSGDANEEPKEQ